MTSSASGGGISTELKFLIASCQLNFRSSVADTLPALVGLDWNKFARLAAFHRVEGLAYRALSSTKGAPFPSVFNGLSAAAEAIAIKNLRSAAECKRILAEFQAENIPVQFLKGLAVGALAYRVPFAKSAVDTDILIDAPDLALAASLLGAAGYRLVIPHRSTLAAWHARSKESVWVNESKGFQLDLHTRTADNPALIASIDVHSAKQWVLVAPGIELPTLATDELIAYLAVHGASSAWFRLKWISDFAALLDGFDEKQIESRYARTQELGAGRASGQALIVADRLFGTLANCHHLRNALLNDRATRRLANTALRLLTREPAEPTASLWGTASIHYCQILLLPGLRLKFFEVSAQARRLIDRARI
jgi:hypothetical protein